MILKPGNPIYPPVHYRVFFPKETVTAMGLPHVLGDVMLCDGFNI